ncbi:MAG TPA: PCRF domain-containing protein, partial [bacterium]|nr:PCRF domain-containing protein [bacterium]
MGGGFDLAAKQRQLATLQAKAQTPDLWSDPEQAGQLLKRIEVIQTEINNYQATEQRLADLAALAATGEIDAITADLMQTELQQIIQLIEQLENSRFFDQPHDDLPVILSI